MSNLLQIESALLNLPTVKAGLNITEIRRVQRTLTNAQKSKFTNTINLSKLVVKAHEWFVSDEGKAVFREEGVTWSNEEFGKKVFGWQKSYFYKVLKAGKLQDEVVDLFNTKCDEAEAEGQDPNRSLEGLLKFARAAAETTTTTPAEGSGDEEETEGSGEGEGGGSEAAVEVRVPTLLTLSFKAADMHLGRNVSIRVDVNGQVTTGNTEEEIHLAIQFLATAIAGRSSN
jgi:hypothetical protein